MRRFAYFLVTIVFLAVIAPAHADDQKKPKNDKEFVHNLDVMWPGQQGGKLNVAIIGYHFSPWCLGRFCGPGLGVSWSVKPNVDNGSSLELIVPFGVRINSRDGKTKLDYYFNAAPTLGKGGFGVGVGLSVSPRPKN